MCVVIHNVFYMFLQQLQHFAVLTSLWTFLD